VSFEIWTNFTIIMPDLVRMLVATWSSGSKSLTTLPCCVTKLHLAITSFLEMETVIHSETQRVVSSTQVTVRIKKGVF
jgi:hypothetical protein